MENLGIQKLVAQLAVERLQISILPGTAWLDVWCLYPQIVLALRQTMQLTAEIDEAIPEWRVE